jgi:cell wall-associated NlpC family hydrolase
VAALQTYLARTLRGAPPVVVETAPNKPLRPPDEPESDEFERIVQTFAAYRSLLDGDVQLPAPTTVPSRPRAADAVITGREVSVRSGPGLKHERIAVAAQGTAVQVLQKTSEWSRVAFTNGTVGWVSQDLLRPQEKPAVPPAAALLPGPPAAPQGNHPFVAEALRHQGVPYVWGGASTSGFDCSGLIQYIARKYGLQVPHYAASLVHLGYPVPRSDLQAGDLVFFQNTYKPGVSHVGIYVGAGRFIHASSSHGVTTSDLSEAYYVEHYHSARRLLTPQEWREAPRTVRR